MHYYVCFFLYVVTLFIMIFFFFRIPKHVLGTVYYQAPEVLRGKGYSDRSDIFSLGVTAWHLLTLTQPFHGLHPHVVLYQVR